MPPVAIPWVAAGIGALGLFQASNAQRQAQNNANAQLSLQQQEIARQNAAYDALMKQYTGNVANGVYNSAANVAAYKNALSNNQKIVSGNIAANAVVMGYRPGDTPVSDAMLKNSNDFALQEAMGERQIIDQKQLQQMNDLSRATGAATSLNAGIYADTNNAAMYQSQANAQGASMGGILGSMANAFQKYKAPPVINNASLNVATGNPYNFPTTMQYQPPAPYSGPAFNTQMTSPFANSFQAPTTLNVKY